MTDKQELRIVSAVADKKQAVLYLEDGNTIILKQGDHRLGDLLDKVIPITTRGETAVVNLTDFSIYAAFEQKSQGLTKFFRVAKDKVSGWFGGKKETHELHIPEEGKAAILRAVAGEVMSEETVMEHGQPIDMNDEIGPNEVVVAVVTTLATETTPAKKTVIPGVNSIKPLIDHAVKTNSVGVQAFLARCAEFIDKRQHSVDDLMRFLEKGDLPLADDGSIIAYKMLRYKDGQKDVFVDCHSRSIEQRVGSYVCVNENLVDLNRRNECSNGLHIARRGYLGSFGGDVCVLCKIDPEDVMVVPHNDPNKVRVKGYHILGVMSPEAMKALQANKPATSEEEALKMVYNAIKGHHIDRIERVQVNGQMGRNVVVTKLRHDKQKARDDFDHTGSDLAKAAALDDDANLTGAVDPREINKRVTEEHNKLINKDANVENSHKELADKAFGVPAKNSALQNLLEEFQTSPSKAESVTAARAILAFKKSKKKGWDKLGISAAVAQDIEAAAKTEEIPAKEPEPAPEPKVGTKEKNTKAAPAAKEPVKSKTKATPPAKVIPPTSQTPTKAEQARMLFNAGKMDDLKEFKKRAKKSWEVLGFNSKEIEKITK